MTQAPQTKIKGRRLLTVSDECKSKGLVDTILADVMGFSQKETSEMFEISRSAISKRATGENQEEYDRLKTIMLEEAAREAGKLLARDSHARLKQMYAEKHAEKDN